MVTTVSPATATLEYPSPTPVPFHATVGPSSGQDLSRPFSVDTPSRFGPRNCGRSASAGRGGRAVSRKADPVRERMRVVPREAMVSHGGEYKAAAARVQRPEN